MHSVSCEVVKVLCYLAASPSPPGRSGGHAEGGEGLANIALHCVSTDQSDLTVSDTIDYIALTGIGDVAFFTPTPRWPGSWTSCALHLEFISWQVLATFKSDCVALRLAVKRL